MFIKRQYKDSDNLSTGKIFAFHITNKGGGFCVFKELLQFNKKKTSNLIQITSIKGMKSRTREKLLALFVIGKMHIKTTSNRLATPPVFGGVVQQ